MESGLTGLLERTEVPSTRVNGGDFRFSITTAIGADGYRGKVYVDGVHVWTNPVPSASADAAYSAARRAVAEAFRSLLNA